MPQPRKGISHDLHIYPGYADETTMGHREQVTWSSIRHLCVSEIAYETLRNIYNISDRDILSTVASNISLYITQAFDFYSSASDASPSTSPLFYYYSFMNLAKALCEIKYPDFRKKPESYRHGLSWRPKSDYITDIQTESIRISSRGIWHILSEILTHRSCNVPNPTLLNIRDLFACCPEICSEYERSSGQYSRIVQLDKPAIVHDDSQSELWIKFSVYRHELEDLKMSHHDFPNLISDCIGLYRQVSTDDPDLYTFELSTPITIPPNLDPPWAELVMPIIRNLNLFVFPCGETLEYYVPIQNNLPIRLPQLILLYTLIFWLGSLVRYDPRGVAYLQDSRYWILLEALIFQSRILLLELFEWEFYQTETRLSQI